MVGDRKWASYCFKPSSEAAHAINLLKSREGYLVVDAHGNYECPRCDRDTRRQANPRA